MVVLRMFPIVLSMHVEHSLSMYDNTCWSCTPPLMLLPVEASHVLVVVGMLILD